MSVSVRNPLGYLSSKLEGLAWTLFVYTLVPFLDLRILEPKLQILEEKYDPNCCSEVLWIWVVSTICLLLLLTFQSPALKICSRDCFQGW